MASSIVSREVDQDGSAKYLFRTRDGRLVEGVRFTAPAATLNLCLSSQVGCPYRCTHCATGLLRFERNLTVAEIVHHASQMSEGAVFDPLFLGQGEPFLNLSVVLYAIDVMVERSMIHRVQSALIGTSGVADGWTELARRAARPALSVSIHGVPDAVRVQIVPHGVNSGLVALERHLRDYQQRSCDRVTLNYTPLAGINDSDENFEAFARFAQRFDCTVRLIPYNAIRALPHRRSPEQRLTRCFEILSEHGVAFIHRPSAAVEVLGGCGQLGLLAYEKETGTPSPMPLP